MTTITGTLAPAPVPVPVQDGASKLNRVPIPIAHTGRREQNFPGANYFLPSDEKEKRRLNEQHEMIKRSFGRVILAPIQFSDTEPQYVLDVGTGAGSWIMDVARSVPPTVHLHGIDIETGLTPKPPSIPPNVSFSTNTVTNLPLDWTSHFHLVHQRLLVAALTQPHWRASLSQLYRVLRPGGWVQLTESGPRFEHNAMTPSQLKLRELARRVYRERDLVYDIVMRLVGYLEAAGFCGVECETKMFPLGGWAGEEGVAGARNFISVHRGMKNAVLRSGGYGVVGSEEEFDALLDTVEQEWDATPGLYAAFTTIWGQKPLVQ